MTNNLYFINSRNQRRLIAENVDIDGAYEAINKFLEERNFKSYYKRIWPTDEGIMFDVGSHTEFFLWEGVYEFGSD